MENENINEELLKRSLNSTEKSNLEENNSFDNNIEANEQKYKKEL